MKQIIIMILLILPFGVYSQAITKKYYSKYSFKDEKLKILYKIESNVKQIEYLKSFWIVYYNEKDQVVGEEFYRNWRLQYYYLYRYTENQVQKIGFFWHGITDKAFFHVRGRYIWQGYYFRRDPDIWLVYDAAGKIVSKSYFEDRETNAMEHIALTDRYFYDNNKLQRIDRYREGQLTMTYHIKE